MTGADFRTFLASLAATAAATLNHAEKLLEPQQDETAKRDPGEQIRTALAASQQLVETLAMLEQKTRGNLAADEEQFLRSALAELRISYVRVLDRSRSATKT